MPVISVPFEAIDVLYRWIDISQFWNCEPLFFKGILHGNAIGPASHSGVDDHYCDLNPSLDKYLHPL